MNLFSDLKKIYIYIIHIIIHFCIYIYTYIYIYIYHCDFTIQDTVELTRNASLV